jgi:hypothetical protein
LFYFYKKLKIKKKTKKYFFVVFWGFLGGFFIANPCFFYKKLKIKKKKKKHFFVVFWGFLGGFFLLPTLAAGGGG